MSEIISIDFGNTYTKVALRSSSGSQSTLLTDKSIKSDVFNACVPTVAAVLETPTRAATWHFGTDLAKFRADSLGLKVYRNWKPRFFDLQTISPRPIPLVAPTTGRRRVSAQPTLAPVVESEPDYRALAIGYFSWLLEFWKKACHNSTGKPIREIPTRISMPSFGNVANAESLLKEILVEAGWRVDLVTPTLPEPLSNAIGALSNGANALMPGGRDVDLGTMFKDTWLYELMRGATLSNGPRTAWVMIVDVGGYTTDFAMLGVDLAILSIDPSEDIDGKPTLRHMSRPLGITDLDTRMGDALPTNKKAAIDKRIQEPDSYMLEAMHINLYNKFIQPIGGGQTIGGTAAEKAIVQEVIANFATDVANYAEDFLNAHNYDVVDDLILTGGGTQIETVRKTVVDRLRHYKVQRAHCHLMDDGKTPFPLPYRDLSAQLPRGATAIGGASVYFDFPSTS